LKVKSVSCSYEVKTARHTPGFRWTFAPDAAGSAAGCEEETKPNAPGKFAALRTTLTPLFRWRDAVCARLTALP